MRQLAATLLLIALAGPAEAGTSRQIAETIPLGAADTVRIDLSVGDFRIEAVPGSDVKVDLVVRCRWKDASCERVLESVRLERRSSKRWLMLRLAERPSWGKLNLEIEGTFEVPRGAAIEVDMGVGKLDVRDVSRDLTIDLGVGRVMVRALKRSFGPVSLDVGVGEAELFGPGERVGGRRSLVVGSEIFWDQGEGASRLDVEVGVGEVSVWLDETL